MTRLLVVDDSALMRRLMSELFEAEGFEVSVARDGAEALEVLAAFAPDVVTLDVQMPGLDGLACLDRIMVERPTPVVMVSAVTRESAEETIRALELGAVEVVAKPAGALSLRMEALAPRLVEAVRAAAQVRLPSTLRLRDRVRARAAQRTLVQGGTSGQRTPSQRTPDQRTHDPKTPHRKRPRQGPAAERPAARPQLSGAAAQAIAAGPEAASAPEPAGRRTGDRPEAPGLVVVGCSTGGPAALDAVLGALPHDFPWPLVVAQHMPGAFTAALARRLDGLCALGVEEVDRMVRLEPGRAYIGRGETDVIVAARPDGLVALPAPAGGAYRWHPSVDRLADSAQQHLPAARIIGVLMTGMGDDGAAAMTRLRRAGGRTIAEAEETAVVWGMPGELVRAGGAEVVAPLDQIAERLRRLVCAR